MLRLVRNNLHNCQGFGVLEHFIVVGIQSSRISVKFQAMFHLFCFQMSPFSNHSDFRSS